MVCTPLVTSEGTVVGIVCGPSRLYRRYYDDCEVCQRRRRMVRRWDGMYYGYTERCCACGQAWQDGCAVPEYKDDDGRAIARAWWVEAMPPRAFDLRIRSIERSYFEDDA
jgi:hypothetical protein